MLGWRCRSAGEIGLGLAPAQKSSVKSERGWPPLDRTAGHRWKHNGNNAIGRARPPRGGAEGPDAEAMNSWWHWAGGKKEWEEPGVSKKDEDSSSVVERDYTLGWRTGSQRQRRGWWY